MFERHLNELSHKWISAREEAFQFAIRTLFIGDVEQQGWYSLAPAKNIEHVCKSRQNGVHMMRNTPSMMKRKGLQIVTKPLLGSNKCLEEDFTAEIFRRVERTSRSKAPQFFFFRPQCRPKEDFDENIAPLLKGELPSKDIIVVSISNNTEKSDAYLDDTEFKFKLKVKFVLTEGRLDIDRNEEALLKLTNMLIEAYEFRNLEEGEDTKNEEQDTEMIEELDKLRSQLKDVEEPVTLLILNDFMSEYTTSLLSALEDVEFPFQQREMQATQFHAYKWNNIRIIDPGSSKDIDLVKAFLDQESKNGKLGIIIVKVSEVDFEDQKMRIKSIATREEVSWHIVVTMETANVPSGDEPQENQELQRLSIKSKLSKDNIHFVKNYTDAKTEHLHLTVLKDIVDCENTNTVPEPARGRWLVNLLYILLIVALVTAIAYSSSTTCLESMVKIPGFISNKCFNHIQRFLHYALSSMRIDS